MKKRILSLFITLALSLNLFAGMVFALPEQAGQATNITLGETVLKTLQEGTTHWYKYTADEDLYHRFDFRNKSLEVNTGIGFIDGFLNLFVGKMTVTVYDQYDERLSSLNVKCGYSGTLSIYMEKGQTYYIKIDASVSGNYTMVGSKTADIAGNNWKDATTIESTGEIISKVDVAGDQDWFTFTTDEIRSYYYFSLESVQSDALRIWVYEDVGGGNDTAPRDKFDYYVSKNSVGEKDIQLESNRKYYMCVLCDSSNGTGDYILNIERTADAAGNTHDESYEVEVGTEYISSFDGSNDYDYYKFETKDYDAYYHIDFIELSGGSWIEASLIDANGNTVRSSNCYGNRSMDAKLTPNSTYYVLYKAVKKGNYKFLITSKADIYPNEKENATQVQLETEYTSSFDGTYDTDFVKFTTLPEDAYYHVDLTSLSVSSYLEIYLYDISGNQVSKSEGYGNRSLDAKLACNSTYYLKLYTTGEGNYSFKVTPKKDIYPNNRENATQIALETEYTSSFDGAYDTDYVKFNTLDANGYYYVDFTSLSVSSYLEIYLYDSNGNQVSKSEGYGNRYVSGKLPANSVAYVKIYTNGEGNYKFTITAKEDYEGDTKSKAYKLNVPQKYMSALEASDDVDWYEINLSSYVDLLVHVLNESCSNISFEVYNARENRIMSSSKYSTGELSKHAQVDAGTYYIRVNGKQGYYTITVSPCGSGHSEVTDYAKQASCEGTGLTEGKHCSVCGTVTKKQEIIGALGHNYVEGKCTRCGKKDENYVPFFTDVAEGAWYKEYIDYAVKYGILSGVGNNLMKPNNNITRAQFVQVLSNLEGIDTNNKNISTRFNDVKSGQWFAPAVKWASDNAIVDGVGSGKFNPNGNLTREQMCKMIIGYVNYKGVILQKPNAKANFADDKTISNWAYNYVYECQMSALVEGTNGYFNPKKLATRAQVATIMTRFDRQYNVVTK